MTTEKRLGIILKSVMCVCDDDNMVSDSINSTNTQVTFTYSCEERGILPKIALRHRFWTERMIDVFEIDLRIAGENIPRLS